MVTMKRNCTIELLRFIFAVVIVIFHFGQRYYIYGIGSNGYLGVEFFFLISGWFLAQNAYWQDSSDIGRATFNYLLKKISNFAIPYYICWTGSYLISNIFSHATIKDYVLNFFRSIPEAVFLRSTGMQMVCYVSQTWYISAMILTIVLCYPLLCRLKKVYIYCIAPLVAVFVLGLISTKYGTLADVDVQIGIFTKGFLRALAVMNLGVFMYGIGQKVREISLSKVGMTVVSIAGFFMVTWLIAYSILPINLGLDFVFCLICAIALFTVLSFDTRIEELLKRRQTIVKMGKLSLYIYLVPAITNNFLSILVDSIHSNIVACIAYILIVIVVAAALEVCSEYLGKKLSELSGKMIQ